MQPRIIGIVSAVLILWSGLAPLAAAAEMATPVAIETLFSYPRYGRARLSPNTKLLATTAMVGERMRLVVVDLDAKTAKPIAGFDDADVVYFRWVNDKRLVFSVGDQREAVSDQPGAGLFAIDVDGSNFKELMPTFKKQANSAAWVNNFRASTFLARCKGSDDILVMTHESDKKGIAIMRQNTRTGRQESAVRGVSGDITDGFADAAGVLRAVNSVDSDGRLLLWYRAAADAPWQEIARYQGIFAPDVVTPAGFSPDGKTMWVSAAIGRDTDAIFAYDLAARKLGEQLVAHPTADVDGGLIIDTDTGELLGIHVDADKPQSVWFDEKWAQAQATVDAALPGYANALSGESGGRILVYSHSDRDPGRYYLYDKDKRSLTQQFAIKPEIKPAAMATMRWLPYEARDKLRIPAYLSLPPGGPKTGLPLIVLVHGGPYMRDHWGFDREVQFLATRGYAVLQPQFRGSTGFGNRHFRAGWKTWGLAMQDDITDGVRYLVKEGIVDPKRVCIMGASYGGYAVMMGLVKDPDLYRCGVSFAGVSDINLMYSVGWSDSANSLWADFGMTELIGDPDKLKEQFIATSPIKQAVRIKAPLLLTHATQDYRVPIIHGEKMRDALKSAGKEFEWIAYPAEGHGMTKSENRFAHYRSIEAFLAKHLGGAIEKTDKTNN